MAYDPAKSKFASKVLHYGGGTGGRRQIIYGAYGSGKTTYACSAPAPLFLDTEYGENERLAEAKHPYIPLQVDNAHFICCDILRNWIAGADVFDPDGGPFADRKTCVIDSWTKLNKLILKQTAAKNGRDISTVRPTFEDYRVLGTQQEEVISLLTTLSIRKGVNVIITALPRIEGDEAEDLKRDANSDTGYKEVVGMPALIGAYRKQIGAEFQDMYYLEVVDGATKIRRLWTVSHNNYLAKTRLGLPEKIDMPTFDKVNSLAKM